MNEYTVPCCDCDIVLYKMTWHFCTRSTCRYVLRDGLELDGWKFDRFPCENIDIIPFAFGMVMGRLRKFTFPLKSTAQELFFMASYSHFIYRVIKSYIFSRSCMWSGCCCVLCMCIIGRQIKFVLFLLVNYMFLFLLARLISRSCP